jgi:hypothetical protein
MGDTERCKRRTRTTEYKSGSNILDFQFCAPLCNWVVNRSLFVISESTCSLQSSSAESPRNAKRISDRNTQTLQMLPEPRVSEPDEKRGEECKCVVRLAFPPTADPKESVNTYWRE